MIQTLLVCLFCVASLSAAAQDTIRVMQYNLLYYGGTTAYCDVSCKDAQLRTIVGAVNPDVLSVNEVSANAVYLQRILINVLNYGGGTDWASLTYENSNHSDRVSSLFYRKSLLKLYRQQYIAGGTRDIIVSTFYYANDNALAQGDTLFIQFYSAHLKAGGTVSGENTRASETLREMQWITTNSKVGNRIMVGDFNVYAASDSSFSHLIDYKNNPSVNFHDPINQLGSWSANSAFKKYHTQCTRVNAEADGGSTGGSDDRFDFILTSAAIHNHTERMQYLPGSYTTVGQDGNHFNGAVNVAGNTSVTATVANALYKNSDHYPVYADFVLDVSTTAVAEARTDLGLRILGNPAQDKLMFTLDDPAPATFQVVDALGRNLLPVSQPFTVQAEINISQWPSGIYVLSVQSLKGTECRRFVKN